MQASAFAHIDGINDMRVRFASACTELVPYLTLQRCLHGVRWLYSSDVCEQVVMFRVVDGRSARP